MTVHLDAVVEGAPGVAPLDAKLVAFASALFAFPVVMIALAWIEPWAAAAAQAFVLQ